MIDLLFVAHNRLEFTRASFETLLENTNWELVRRLHVVDDRSTDGTWEFLRAAVASLHNHGAFDVDCVSDNFGGPVAVMNYTVDELATDKLAKVDNDVIVCPGWLDALLAVMEAHPGLDALGFEPGFAGAVQPADRPRSFVPARHIGGIGLLRARIFQRKRPRPHDRFFGWTLFQTEGSFAKGWVDPDLPCFLLDHLPFDPWRSLAARYVDAGWQRAWPSYPEDCAAYWDWWTRDRAIA